MRMVENISRGEAPTTRYSGLVRLAFSIGGCTMIALSAGCRETSAAAKEPVRQQTPAQAAMPEALATVGDEKISMAQVRELAGGQLDQLETQYQLAKSKIITAALDSILREKTVIAEAKKQNKSVEDLIAAEAGPGGVEPNEVEIATWFKENQDRVNGRTLDQVRPQIADLLRKERHTAAAAKLEDRIRAERKVAVTYQPFRLQFANEGAPTKGSDKALVTLVEFSDFQCPYCQRVAPTLKQVEAKYGDKVRIVYRQYPLSNIHANAFKAAEASLCANEQGKFWPLHDAMFADQTKLSVSELKETAGRLGVDRKKFDACLNAGRYVEQVQNDLKEGQRAGVTGTPALFLDGRAIDGGAVSFSVLDAAIQKALAREKPGTQAGND